jgi:putative ABC transport system permease protein
MDTFTRDLRHAVRMLRKTPVFTMVVVFTLAIGIGASTAMFSIVNGVLLQGLPFANAERIVDINEVERGGTGGAIAPATFFDWRRMATSFDVMAVYATRVYNVTPATGEPARVRGTMVSSTFFDVLGVRPILGRGFTPADAEPGQGQTVVLSYGFWQRQFAAGRDIVNQQVRLNGQPHTIVGVMPATVNFPDTSNFWVPAAYDAPSCGGPGADPRGEASAG